ncbi:MAG: DUF6228 family protein [Elainellaceae cyanobacterium]
MNCNTSLVFSDLSSESFQVQIDAADHSAKRLVYAYTDITGLSRLFSDAAKHWSGWSKAKVWESLEGKL